MGDEKESQDELVGVSRKEFEESFHEFMSRRGTPLRRVPVFDREKLDFFRLYREVASRGGMKKVTEKKLWRQVTMCLSIDPERTDAGFRLRHHYQRLLYPYERVFLHHRRDKPESRRLKKRPVGVKPRMLVESHSPESHPHVVNFHLLGDATLTRYKNAFHLNLPDDSSREDLLGAVCDHFCHSRAPNLGSLASFFNTMHTHLESSTDSGNELAAAHPHPREGSSATPMVWSPVMDTLPPSDSPRREVPQMLSLPFLVDDESSI